MRRRCVNSSRSRIIGRSWLRRNSLCVVKSVEGIEPRPPKGFLPLPHQFHPTGGFVFPKDEIDAMKRQDGRDLTRFDLDFDLPERFSFSPSM